MLSVLTLFFFFSSRRRHTRCSRDWSSDVCSSDLLLLLLRFPGRGGRRARVGGGAAYRGRGDHHGDGDRRAGPDRRGRAGRSEERRVGKECRWGWGPGEYRIEGGGRGGSEGGSWQS